MIRAIIFDCFGVLTNDGWLAFKEQYLSRDDDMQRQAIELNRRADARLISQDQFEEALANLTQVSIDEVRRVIDTHAPNSELFDYIAHELKPHYKIGLLSNVAADYTSELFAPEQNALFDAKTFSFELGVVKPHPAMYETIAAKLEVLPEECVFVDDRELFTAGAKEVGMHTVWFRSNDQLRVDLPTVIDASNA